MIRAGVPDVVARTISGHRIRSVLDHHNIVDDKDLRDAVKATETYVSGLPSERDEGRVVPMKRSR